MCNIRYCCYLTLCSNCYDWWNYTSNSTNDRYLVSSHNISYSPDIVIIRPCISCITCNTCVMGMMVMMKKVYKTEIKSASVIKKSFYFFGILHTNHADSVGHLESFRALKLTLSKSFTAHPFALLTKTTTTKEPQ